MRFMVLAVRATVNLDDELLRRAAELTGTKEPSGLLKQGLVALIERESARRLVLLGGSDPAAQVAPRRRERAD